MRFQGETKDADSAVIASDIDSKRADKGETIITTYTCVGYLTVRSRSQKMSPYSLASLTVSLSFSLFSSHVSFLQCGMLITHVSMLAL